MLKNIFMRRGGSLIGEMVCLNIHQLAYEYVKKYNLDVSAIEGWFDKLVEIFKRNGPIEKFDARS